MFFGVPDAEPEKTSDRAGKEELDEGNYENTQAQGQTTEKFGSHEGMIVVIKQELHDLRRFQAQLSPRLPSPLTIRKGFPACSHRLGLPPQDTACRGRYSGEWENNQIRLIFPR